MLAKYEQLLNEYPEEEIWVCSELMHIGVPQHLKGYKFIVAGLLLCVKSPGYLDSYIKGLYPAIADVFDSSTSRVERGIRYALEVAWAYGDSEYQHKLFGYTIPCEKSKPINSVFMSTIYDRLKRAMREAFKSEG